VLIAVERVEVADPIAWATENGRGSDLFVLAGIDAAHECLDRIPGFAERRFVVAIAAHGAAPVAQPARSTGLVGGRSIELTP
jgi:hypothetical protein